MRKGFTYKGLHSSQFGAVAKTKSRPVLPEMKSYTFESPIEDGAYDFSAVNEYGRAFYNDRFFEVQLQISADNLRLLEKKVSKTAAWLKGSGELIFDDMPMVKCKSWVGSEMGFVPELYGRKAVLTAAFRVEPFSFAVFDTADGPVIDSAFELDLNIPLDISDVLTWYFTGDTSSYTYISKTLEAVNAGNVHARPIIRIDGSVKNITLSCGDKELIINTSASGFIIDLKKQTVTDSDGESVMKYVGGDFFELGIPSDSVDITLYVMGEAVVSIEYEPRFIYDFDLDDVDWSVSNA
ncbi:MAG: phage tail family protein [Oscillospiraceae bacterium]|nr:phage tail family protein [Oscillospiraceae bacterium]